MADIKKLFVHVSGQANVAAFESADKTNFANKVVFLDGDDRRIWAKGKYYGSTSAEYKALMNGSASSANKFVTGVTLTDGTLTVTEAEVAGAVATDSAAYATASGTNRTVTVGLTEKTRTAIDAVGTAKKGDTKGTGILGDIDTIKEDIAAIEKAIGGEGEEGDQSLAARVTANALAIGKLNGTTDETSVSKKIGDAVDALNMDQYKVKDATPKTEGHVKLALTDGVVSISEDDIASAAALEEVKGTAEAALTDVNKATGEELLDVTGTGTTRTVASTEKLKKAVTGWETFINGANFDGEATKYVDTLKNIQDFIGEQGEAANSFLNLKSYVGSDETANSLGGRVTALEGLAGTASVADQIATEIGKLDKADTAVADQYVSAVSETDGIITVTRVALPVVKSDIEAINAYTVNGKTISTNPTLTGEDINATYTDAAGTEQTKTINAALTDVANAAKVAKEAANAVEVTATGDTYVSASASERAITVSTNIDEIHNYVVDNAWESWPEA